MTSHARTAEQTLSGWIASAELPILLAISPALLFPTPWRLAVLSVLPLVAWANLRTRGRVIPETPLNGPLVALLLMTAISLLVTFDVHNSLGKVAGVLLDVLIFWAVTRWIDRPQRLSTAVWAFILAGVALAVIGLLGTNWFGKFGALSPVIARLPKLIRGLPGAEDGFQPNAVAGCLVLFVPVQVALLTQSWRRSTPANGPAAFNQWLQLACLMLTAGTLVLTQSRGAWTGVAIAFLVFLAWYRRATRVVSVVLLAGVVGVTAWMGPRRVFEIGLSQSGPSMLQNVSGRTELWSRAVDAIQDFPWTGMGMNSFRRLMPTMYPTLSATPTLDVAHAHNHLLQAALDLGIPGLIAYLAIWLIVAGRLVRTYRRSREPWIRAAAGGLGAGLIAHFAFGLADVIPLGSKVGILFWVTLALSISLDRVVSAREPANARA